MQKREISDELQSHILDLIDEYIAGGFSREEAEHKAQTEFGDTSAIAREVNAYHGIHAQIGTWMFEGAFVLYILVTVLAVSLARVLSNSALGATIAQLALGLVTYAIVSINVLCVKQIVQYYGLRKPQVIRVVAAWTLLSHIAITMVLDIDKFEGVLHSLIVMGGVFALTWAAWKKLSVFLRTTILYAVPAFITFVALQEIRLLNVFGTMRCLFITPDSVPLSGALQSCIQVHLWSPVLWPILIAGIASVYLVGTFLKTYLTSSQTRLPNKILMATTSVSMIFAPAAWTDVNNTGTLDIVEWTPQIYEAYQGALGRRPEQKDLDYYAITRSYQHMDAVRNTLFASYERTLKINLIYREVLKRDATQEEIAHYVESKTPVAQIYQELQAKVPLE